MYIDHEKLELLQESYSLLESPIEKIMYLSIGHMGSALGKDKAKEVLKEYCFTTMPQRVIGEYRVDFHISAFKKDSMTTVGSTPIISMVIECDGHEYHNITKEQAQKDRKRDRDLQAQGHVVFRFTGSEIYNDPLACAAECFEYLYKKLYCKPEESTEV